jgi:hypothetical protein
MWSERGVRVLEQNPQAVLLRTLSTRKCLSELVEICGSDEGARALVEQTAAVFKGARPKKNFESPVEGDLG